MSTPESNKFISFLREHGFSLVLGLVIVLLIVSPDAKAWALRQIMKTGIFNAKIEEQASDLKQIHDFSYSDEQGNVFSTERLRGKVVFINFWASWCPPCRAEFPSIQTLYERFKDHPQVEFIMINQDDDVAVGKNYLQNEGLTVPIHRLNGPLSHEIYTGSLPTTLIFAKDGSIRFKHEGFANYASSNFMEQIESLIKKD
ncbi:redoxin domain-containing protein [Sphingobacterium sp. DK4209]|uniref:Redoxin domain-containing protein n=1 Tax=Sphingobacterium zhuxiongii TaxID=2662364 RepID=A0A5Q0QDY2_9SPHI|nr:MULTISPECIES: TlpA disulfide reductase family protein [unclassified Sphingobacterium]MVZ67626.1 redoxin domain-containing protein [Sphingobacterium sp. DK4209]QGA27141.1 redoxin domain-containing protein [Sphingobacterium sp. dk4302]